MGKPVASWTPSDYAKVSGMTKRQDVPASARRQLLEKMAEYEARNFSAGFPSSAPGSAESIALDPEPSELDAYAAESRADDRARAKGETRRRPAPRPIAPSPEAPMSPFDQIAAMEEEAERNKINRDHPFLAAGKPEHENYKPWFTAPGITNDGSSYAMRARKVWEPTLEEYIQASPEAQEKIREGQKPTKDDRGYRIFADERWAAEYEKAKEAGEDIVRAEYLPKYELAQGGVMNTIMGASHMLENSVEAGLLGAASGATLGALPEAASSLGSMLSGRPAAEEMQDFRRIAEDHMPANVVGTIGGAIRGAPGMIAGSVMSALPRAASLGGRLATGALVGASTATVEGGVEDTVHALADRIRSVEGKVWDKYDTNMSFNPFAGGIATDRAMMGGAFGAGGELLGAAAGASVRALRDPNTAHGKALAALEEATGRRATGVTPSGIRRIPELEKLNKGSATKATGPERAAWDLAPELAEEAYKQAGKAKASYDDFLEAYARTPEGRERVTMQPIVDDLARYIREHSFDDGTKMPFVGSGFDKALLASMHFVPVTPGSVRPPGHAVSRKAIESIFGDEGRKALDAADSTLALPPSAGNALARSSTSLARSPGLPESPGRVYQMPGSRATAQPGGPVEGYVMVPRELNAKELSSATGAFDSFASSKANEGSRETILDTLSSTYREIRREFRPNSVAPASSRASLKDPRGGDDIVLSGYAAKHEELNSAINSAQSRIGDIGGNPSKKVVEDTNALRAAVAERLVTGATNEIRGEQLQAAVDVIFRQRPEMTKRFVEISAAENYQALLRGGKYLNMAVTDTPSLVARSAKPVELARMWADPVFIRLSQRFGEAPLKEVVDAWKILPHDQKALVRGVSTMPYRLGKLGPADAFSARGGGAAGIWTMALDTPSVDDIIVLAGLAEMAKDVEAETREAMGGAKRVAKGLADIGGGVERRPEPRPEPATMETE